MKSTKRWYLTNDSTHRVPFSVAVAVVGGLVFLLCCEGLHRARLEKRNAALEAILLKLDEQASHLDTGLRKCAEGHSIRVEYPNSTVFVEVECKAIRTNAWDNKKIKRSW